VGGGVGDLVSDRIDKPRKWVAAAIVTAISPLLLEVTAQDEPPPLTIDLLEETGISLTLFEVEARDKQGRPIPGLTRDDFTVIINGRERPIYSVDDLCRVGVTVDDESSAGAESSDASAATDATVGVPHRFILYLDFSRFLIDGRVFALDAAERWVRESMQPGERAQIVAYTSMHGLEMLTDFTDDPRTLLRAIDDARDDTNLFDPFLSEHDSYIYCCLGPSKVSECPAPYWPPPPPCRSWAWEAYRHGKAGFEALRNYLVALDTVPGRKTMMFFQQDGSIFPSRRYGVDEFSSGDMISVLDEVGAEANLSRTTIHSVQTGDSLDVRAGESVNLGANLADFTGGSYNRGTVDLDGFVLGVGRTPRCVYQIAIERPERAADKVFRVKVLLRDRPLPGRFRVRFLDSRDRWLRRAQAVLSVPERASDVRLRAAALPVAAAGKKWEVMLQVALDLDSLDQIPWRSKHQGDWEVGALLSRSGDGKGWEMLAVSRLRADDEPAPATYVVHERALVGLKAGSYRLAAFARDRAAFARDRTANLFGGAEAKLVLPDPRTASVVGPFVVFAERAYLSASLPPLRKRRTDEASRAQPRVGTIPAGEAVRSGEPVDVATLICTGNDRAPEAERLQRYVTRDEEALFRFEPPTLQRAGTCWRFDDRVETRALGPGSYRYHVRWSIDGSDEATEADVEFRIPESIEVGTPPPG